MLCGGISYIYPLRLFAGLAGSLCMPALFPGGFVCPRVAFYVGFHCPHVTCTRVAFCVGCAPAPPAWRFVSVLPVPAPLGRARVAFCVGFACPHVTCACVAFCVGFLCVPTSPAPRPLMSCVGSLCALAPPAPRPRAAPAMSAPPVFAPIRSAAFYKYRYLWRKRYI